MCLPSDHPHSPPWQDLGHQLQNEKKKNTLVDRINKDLSTDMHELDR